MRSGTKSIKLVSLAQDILGSHKGLLWLPMISGLIGFILFLILVLVFKGLDMNAKIIEFSNIGLIVLYYSIIMFTITYSNFVMASAVIDIFEGKYKGIRNAMKRVRSVLPQIIVFALLDVVLTIVFLLIKSRFRKKDMALDMYRSGFNWNKSRSFLIPIVLYEGVGPIQAYKRAFILFFKKLGVRTLGRVTVGVTIILYIVGGLIISYLLIKLFISFKFVPILVIILFVLYLSFVFVYATTLQSILSVVLYRYATGKKIPENIKKMIQLLYKTNW